jgi:hypothetical protein
MWFFCVSRIRPILKTKQNKIKPKTKSPPPNKHNSKTYTYGEIYNRYPNCEPSLSGTHYKNNDHSIVGISHQQLSTINQFKTNMQHTLAYLKKEATRIAESWNGEDPTFIADGLLYNEDQAHAASELLTAIEVVESLSNELRL